MRDAEEDPLSHPWLFKAESRAGQLSADRVMFTTLSHSSPQRSRDGASASGLATYAYWLEGDELTGYDLLRWVNPQLAEDHGFPVADSENAVVVAENLAAFSLRFLDVAVQGPVDPRGVPWRIADKNGHGEVCILSSFFARQ